MTVGLGVGRLKDNAVGVSKLPATWVGASVAAGASVDSATGEGNIRPMIAKSPLAKV